VRTCLYLLTGFPGSGKFTVARALAEQIEAMGETARVVDNHWINNPIFGLVDQDGITPLPSEVWDRVGEVADAVIRTVEGLTPRSWHVIFTTHLDGVTDRGFVPRLESVAATRGSVFVPVRLLVDPEENARRITSPERRLRMKSVDPEEPFRLAARGEPYDHGHANTVTMDVTDKTPSETAREILALAAQIAAPGLID
jgi:adenylate kinase